MRERPILFSTEMVKAILDGKKTQTRRIVKPQPDDSGLWDDDKFPRSMESELKGWNGITEHTGESKRWKSPYGEVGDILWVRETFIYRDKHNKYYYKADHYEPFSEPYAHNGWKPSIFMPKEACRIWLEITDIRVERLQDIEGMTASESDAMKEGIMEFHHGDGNYGYHYKGDMDGDNFVHPEDAFKYLWQKINGSESWNENPWVWVIEFKKINRPLLNSDKNAQEL